MSNDQARDFFNQGLAFFNVRNYEPALRKFETSLSLVESWDTQFREKIQKIIEDTKKCAEAKARADYSASQVEKIENILRGKSF